jgi:hypothetical protein
MTWCAVRRTRNWIGQVRAGLPSACHDLALLADLEDQSESVGHAEQPTGSSPAGDDARLSSSHHGLGIVVALVSIQGRACPQPTSQVASSFGQAWSAGTTTLKPEPSGATIARPPAWSGGVQRARM